MPIRTYKPTSAGRRFQTVHVFDEITTSTPYKPLTEPLHKSGGRNNARPAHQSGGAAAATSGCTA